MASYTTTRDRGLRIAAAIDRAETYGGPVQIARTAFPLRSWLLFLATLVGLVVLSVLIDRWDTIGEELAMCREVLSAGPSDHPVAVSCDALLNGEG